MCWLMTSQFSLYASDWIHSPVARPGSPPSSSFSRFTCCAKAKLVLLVPPPMLRAMSLFGAPIASWVLFLAAAIFSAAATVSLFCLADVLRIDLINRVPPKVTLWHTWLPKRWMNLVILPLRTSRSSSDAMCFSSSLAASTSSRSAMSMFRAPRGSWIMLTSISCFCIDSSCFDQSTPAVTEPFKLRAEATTPATAPTPVEAAAGTKLSRGMPKFMEALEALLLVVSDMKWLVISRLTLSGGSTNTGGRDPFFNLTTWSG
mmetsp:Transcript_139155/g.432964  ORF Transcript_139155/g.432964 Transcript_139155/m.432964 type:complete len:260 (-) Transcript_139155:618-1397(-)